MKTLVIFVTGEPKGQPRPKAGKRGRFTQIYDPGTADSWKKLVMLAAMETIRRCEGIGDARPIFTGALRVDITFWFPRPKSHYRANGELKPNAPTYHTAKPDRDNADKAVLDALGEESLQLWKDDAQVADGHITKLYAPPSQAAGARIHILSLED